MSKITGNEEMQLTVVYTEYTDTYSSVKVKFITKKDGETIIQALNREGLQGLNSSVKYVLTNWPILLDLSAQQ